MHCDSDVDECELIHSRPHFDDLNMFIKVKPNVLNNADLKSMCVHAFSQALADGRLHHVRRTLFCLRPIRHVPVRPTQARGQGSRGRKRHAERAHLGLRAARDFDGVASCLHGGVLLACLSGNCGNT